MRKALEPRSNLIKEATQKLSNALDDKENISPNQSSQNTSSFQGSTAFSKKYQGGFSQDQGLNEFSSNQATSLTQKSSISQKHQFQNSTCNFSVQNQGLGRPLKQKKQREQVSTGKARNQEKRRRLIQSNFHRDEKSNLSFEDKWSSDYEEEKQMPNIQTRSECEETIKILYNLDSIQLKMENHKDVSNSLEIIGKKGQINQQENDQPNSYTNYEILGQGTFGKVIHQVNLQTRKSYALKVLKDQNQKRKERIAKREFKVLQTIQKANSPILLQIQDLGDSPCFFARMEYGYGTLDDFLNFCERKRLMKKWTDHDILTLYFQLWSQLQEFKKLKIFHSDIKPQNIIISSEGFFVISDFGISILLKKKGRQKLTIQGTSGYYMPEIQNFLEERRKCKHKQKYQRLSYEYNPMEQDHFACIKTIRRIIRLKKKSDSWEKLLERTHIQKKKDIVRFSERNCLQIYDDNKDAYHIFLFDQKYEAYDWNKKLEMIDTLIDHCHFDPMKGWIEEKLEKAQTENESQEYLYLCFLKGRFLAVQSKYKEALQNYTKCEEALCEFEEGKIGVEFIRRLESEIFEAAVMNYDPELARKYLDKIFQMKLQDGNPTIELAQYYLSLACIEYFEGNREKAVENCHKGLELFGPTNINARFLDLKNLLGVSLEALGRYDQAYEIFQDLYKRLCQVYGETHSKVTKVLSNIAMILDNTGRSNDALSYNLKSLEINYKLFADNKNQSFAYTLMNLTVCYAYLGKLEPALSCARESVQIIENSQNHDPNVFAWMIAIAEICGALKEYEGAKYYLQRYLDSYIQTPNSGTKYLVQRCFIFWDYSIHKRKGNRLAYKKYQNRLEYLAQNPQAHPVDAIVYQRFAIIEIMKGEYKAALPWLRKTHDILDQNHIEESPSFFSIPGINLHKYFKSRTNLEEASVEDLKAFCEEYYERCSPFLIVSPKLHL